MKKLIGTAMLAALLATSAFAEGISFSAWNNMRYVISHDDGNNVQSAFMQQWGKDGARYGSLNIVGDSENAGFQAELHFDNGGIGGLGQLYSYIKPIEQIQLLFGFTDQNYLRSDNCTAMWDYYRPSAFGLGEGLTFDEFEFSGIGLVITPIESLKIVAGYDVDLGGKKGKLHEQIGRSGKLGAAYTIGDIGTVKAGVWAKGADRSKIDVADKDGKVQDRVTLEAAFDLTAIEGVFITVGAKIPLGGTYNKWVSEYIWNAVKEESEENEETLAYFREPVQVNAGVALNLVENLGIQLNFASKINAPQVKDLKEDGQFGFAIALGADYTFAESWKVFGSVGYSSAVYNNSYAAQAATKDKTSGGRFYTEKDALTFGVGVEKSWSNGTLGVAFVGMTNDSNFYFIDAHNDTAFNWAIPIRMTVSF